MVGKYATHLSKYKFNYALKAFLIYNCYREYNNFNYLKSVSFLTFEQQAQLSAKVMFSGALVGGAFWLI
jgi:hypothetical protein